MRQKKRIQGCDKKTKGGKIAKLSGKINFFFWSLWTGQGVRWGAVQPPPKKQSEKKARQKEDKLQNQENCPKLPRIGYLLQIFQK